MNSDEKKRVDQLQFEIGQRLKALREGRDENQTAVTDRLRAIGLSGWEKGRLSRIEKGRYNIPLDELCALILVGLQTDFGEFCTPWLTEDKSREREEQKARNLLERLLRRGKAKRRGVLKVLTVYADSNDDKDSDIPE